MDILELNRSFAVAGSAHHGNILGYLQWSIICGRGLLFVDDMQWCVDVSSCSAIWNFTQVFEKCCVCSLNVFCCVSEFVLALPIVVIQALN